MELGMGIHGESGAQKLKLLPSRQALDLAIGQLVVNSRRFDLKPEDNVLLFVNNLGLFLINLKKKNFFFSIDLFRWLFKS